jgi:hypothetical protein
MVLEPGAFEQSVDTRLLLARCEPSNTASPSSGRVLPVITSIIVVLPAPLGPMTARISA